MQGKVQQRYYLSLTAIFKNEASYLCEWIEYYHLMGVEHFFLYDNGSDDDAKILLAPYVQRGLVTLHDMPGYGMQMKAYNHALEEFGHTTTWMIFCDIDEYILPKNYKSLVHMVKKYDQCQQILVRWLCFGDSGYISRPEGLSVENFLHREASSIHTKPILKPDSVLFFFNMHIAITTGITCTLPYGEAQCNHYVTRSYEEFCCKKALRNRDRPGATIHGGISYTRDFFALCNVNAIYDDSMLHYVPRIKKRLALRHTCR